jgi:Transposase DDE domain
MSLAVSTVKARQHHVCRPVLPREVNSLDDELAAAQWQALPCFQKRCCSQIVGTTPNWIRELARKQGTWANIPPKRNRKAPICFSPYLYRARNLVERFFNKIKQYRRVATRYDKLAANDLAFIKLASIRIWLRANESTLYFNPCMDMSYAWIVAFARAATSAAIIPGL